MKSTDVQVICVYVYVSQMFFVPLESFALL